MWGGECVIVENVQNHKKCNVYRKKLYIWGICVYRERERDVKKLFNIYTFYIHTHTHIYTYNYFIVIVFFK